MSSGDTEPMCWRGRRVFVTGATGLVGSWLVKELLRRGSVVVALVQDIAPQAELCRSGDLGRVTVVRGGLEDDETIERALNVYEIDTVFHLGAQTIVGVAHRAPLQTFDANIRGTYNLLEACRRHSGSVRRVVVASSDKAYGASARLPYTEDMPLAGRHPYEVSKTCADLLAQAYSHTYGLPVAITRCANIYGGGDLNWSRIVPGTIRSLLQGERPVVRSDGQFLRDYIYVEDVAQAYLTLAEQVDDPRVRGEAFNFSVERPVTVLEIVAALRRLLGRVDLTPVVQNSAVGELREQYLSAAKARSVLGWAPRFDLEAGLAATVEWYRALFR